MFSTIHSIPPRHRRLSEILKKDSIESRWNGESLVPTYQNLTRFILMEVFKNENARAFLVPVNIIITSGEAKVLKVTSTATPPPLRIQLKELLRTVLGDRDCHELRHFMNMAGHQRVTFYDLYHHPLLQGWSERFFFPLRTIIHLNDTERSTWRDNYTQHNRTPVSLRSSLETSVYKECFMSVLDDKLHNKTGYRNNVLGVLEFTKNIANHVNQHAKRLGRNRMTLNEIECELTRLFPTRLTDLFEFLVDSGTSLVFLSN